MTEWGTDKKVTWREDLIKEMASHSDPGPVIAVDPSEDVLDERWDPNLYAPDVMAWTEQRVYFDVNDGQWDRLRSAPRNPPTG